MLMSTDLQSLLHDLRAFIYRYVVVTPEQALTIALWIAVTHVLDAFDTVAYLSITSATKRAGKTRLLEVLEPVVRRPWLTGRTSAAALVRKIDADEPTLLLDESDAAFSSDKEYSEALRGILNSGYKRSGKATVCIGKGADISAKDFSTFSAKAIAGIGKLPDTVADRSIPIVLKRKMTSEPVQRWRDRDGRADGTPLHHQLMAWRESAVEVLRAARPSLPDELSDRAQDVWEPLMAIADLAGGDWPARARRAAVVLMGGIEDADPTIELLTDIADILTNDITDDMMSTKDLLEKLVARDDRPWPTWHRGKPLTARGLARLLGPLGVHPHQRRLAGQVLRSYRRTCLEAAIARYLPNYPLQRDSANESGPKHRHRDDFESTSENASVTHSEAESIGVVTLSRINDREEADEHF
jgi:hypothetical protein